MPFSWPENFRPVPDATWTQQPVEKLALNYDTVENHGWYRNLVPTIGQIKDVVRDGDVLIDYSGGTGILADRLIQQIPDRHFGIVLVDSSAKFLRLALEKFRDEPRVAYRLIQYLKDRGRLQFVDEVVSLAADLIVSTNAIHLYYDLVETLKSWRRVIKPGGRVFIQSGNIRNPAMRTGEWIIDETVEAIHGAAQEIVGRDQRYAQYWSAIADMEKMEAHGKLRQKYFLPVRPLDHYLDALKEAGFEVESTIARPIEANVKEWYDFLAVYHEGVLGWVGGVEKIEGAPATPQAIEDRLRIIRNALQIVFEGRESFNACWTYIAARPS